MWILLSSRRASPLVCDRTQNNQALHLSGILHVLKKGCRWRDVPPAFGPPTTIYNRYNRWSQRGSRSRPAPRHLASPVAADAFAGAL